LSSPSTTELAVLGLVAEGRRSGYDLARIAARSTGYMWAPSRSQIYKVLPRLVARGLARSEHVEQDGRPDKALYEITPEGLRALRAWVEKVDEDPAGGPPVFLLKLLLGFVSTPAAARAQIRAYRALVERNLAAFEAQEAGLPDDEPVYSLIALRHGIRRARATIEWADEAERLLDA
jgi:DNA-binding PadR family transcriptional regulator